MVKFPGEMRPEEYLESHLEPELDIAANIGIESSMKALEEPLGIVDYKGHDKVKIKRRDVILSLDYSKLPENASGFGDFLEFEAEKDQWKSLDSFSLENKQKNVSYDLATELPLGYKIYFKPETASRQKSSANPDKKFCTISGDLSKPNAILSLLHEIGHCIDYENTTDEFEKEKFKNAHMAINTMSQVSAETLAKILLRERNAWAYALKKVKPFLGESISKKDIMNHIHNYALQTYSKGIREKIAQGLVEFDWADIF